MVAKRSDFQIKSTGLLAALVASSEDAIISKTLDGIVTSWNPAAERIFGYTAQEMIGQPITRLAATGRDDEMPRILDRLRRGERIEHFETQRRRKDAKIIDVSLTISPIHAADGRVVGASKIARDISNAKSEHAALLQREAHLRSIMETMPDAMIVIDELGTIQSFSATAERLFGYGAAEVCGHNVKTLMPSPHSENHDAYLARYRETGERRIIGIGRIVAGQRKDGSVFPMELSIGELRGDGYRLFTGFVRDITERQQTERRLQELRSRLSHVSRLSEMGQMASALAHEVNQPLTAATNYLGALHMLLGREQATVPDRVGAVIANIAAQIERASQIVHRLRDFVKKTEPTQGAEDVVKLVEEASALALIGAKDLGIKVRLHAPSGLSPALVDKVQIQQVIVNLMRNAVEAMESGERRELSISLGTAERDRIEIAVADTGPGIAPKIAERLFQPFVTTKSNGMGVGLSICRSIVEGHGGRLDVSPNPGGGTVFRFTVPAAD